LKDRIAYQPPGISAAGKAYDDAFVRRAHELLGMGYAMLTPGAFASSDEEDITGGLVDAVDAVLDNANAPAWFDWFSVHEDPRVHDPARKGKKCRRLDIRIDSSETRPRPRFCFEAKRLGPNHGVSVYLGSEGLQRFLDGRYARSEMAAGMLGYVQAENPADWASKIEEAMTNDTAAVNLLESSPWRSESLVTELEFTYRSGHDRPNVGAPIEVYHTLLLFN
jgi:hypothetical protein